MTDSLSRLVLRARGRLPMAAPLLSSRFADNTPDAAWGEESGDTTPPMATEARAAVLDAPVMPPGQRESMRHTGEAASLRSPTPNIPAFVDPARPQSAGAPTQDVLPVSPQSGPHAMMPPTIMRQPDLARAAIGAQAPNDARRSQADAPGNGGRESPPPAARPPFDAARPHVALPAERAAEPPLPVSQGPLPALRSLVELSAAPEPSGARNPELIAARDMVASQPAAMPTVRISIGRVEVHAAPAQAAAATAPRQAPSRRPTVSLADYLAGRGRAR